MPTTADALPTTAAGGLLLRFGSSWRFGDGALSDTLLVGAATWPLTAALPEELACLFADGDPWRNRPGLSGLEAELKCGCGDAVSKAPAASVEIDQLRVGRSGSAGRGLFARDAPVAEGTLLLRERAFAAALWPCAFATHCHHCLCAISPRSATAVHCAGRERRLCRERYCSASCRDEAWAQGHCIECGTLMHAIAPRTVLMCVRALLRARDAADSVSAADLDSLLALRDHGVDMSAQRTSQLRFHAHLYATATPGHGPLEAVLAKLLRLALTNSFAVSELVATDAAASDESQPHAADDGSSFLSSQAMVSTEGVRRRTVAEALFPHAGLLNHACAPCANVRHIGRHVEVRAASHLAPGDEACISYGPQAGFQAVAARREWTRRVYHFECACSACAREAAAPTTSQGAVSAWRARAQALDEDARLACERGDFCAAAASSEAALDLLRKVFPDGSPQIAHEEVKLAQLLFNAAADGRARRALERAAVRMAHLYGEADDEVGEMRRLAMMCRS